MSRIIMSLGLIVFVGAIVVGGTGAFFSDTETSTGNVFAAGSVDLKIDNHAWYNGLECANVGTEEDPVYEWIDPEGNANGDSYLESLIGTTCTGTWELTDLEDHLFFDFADLKPGDWEEDTISVHVDDNPSWMCANLTITSDDDVDCTEPELGDDANCDAPDLEPNDNNWDGELASELQFIFWLDDGDNVFEDDESIVLSGTPADLDGYGVDGNEGETFPVADANFSIFGEPGTPVPGGSTFYLGKAFCYGELTLAAVAAGDSNTPALDPGFTCSGALTDNSSQSDNLTADISFYVEQARNNESFLCDEGDDTIGCSEEADVMLVLDVSGSINNTELTTLKDAASSFVTSLNPQTDGVNMGVVEFESTADLLQGLTGDSTLINTAITNAAGGGNTNLEDAIRTAQQELTDNGRPGVPSFIVVITDGEPTAQDGNTDADGTNAGEAADAAADAKAAGSEIFAVGVGIDAGDALYLSNEIVSSPAATHYFDAAEFADLEAILESLTQCDPGDIQAIQVPTVIDGPLEN